LFQYCLIKKRIALKCIKQFVLFLLAGDAVSPNSEQFFLQVRFGRSDEFSFFAYKNVMRRALVEATCNLLFLSLFSRTVFVPAYLAYQSVEIAGMLLARRQV